jgi:RNA polymerase sigma-70 factor (ECF subfamily)
MNHIGTEHIQEDEPNHEEFERLEKLRNCIQKLNDVDKAITTLYLEELPYKEISEITGLTENTIAVRMKRIKIKLLNCINSTLSWKKN